MMDTVPRQGDLGLALKPEGCVLVRSQETEHVEKCSCRVTAGRLGRSVSGEGRKRGG